LKRRSSRRSRRPPHRFRWTQNGGQSLADVAKGLKTLRDEQTKANEKIAGELAALRSAVAGRN
jgi:hypothetical protein